MYLNDCITSTDTYVSSFFPPQVWCQHFFFTLCKIQQWKARLILSSGKMKNKSILLLSSDSVCQRMNHLRIHHFWRAAFGICKVILLQLPDTALLSLRIKSRAGINITKCLKYI